MSEPFDESADKQWPKSSDPAKDPVVVEQVLRWAAKEWEKTTRVLDKAGKNEGANEPHAAWMHARELADAVRDGKILPGGEHED